MIAYGGDPQPHSLLPVPVSLTRIGLPRIIPSFHRKVIRRGDPQSDVIIKVYLSFFSLYRIILLAKKIDKYTFESLETPIADMSSVYDRVTTMKENMVSILERYIPWFTKRPLNQGIDFKDFNLALLAAGYF